MASVDQSKLDNKSVAWLHSLRTEKPGQLLGPGPNSAALLVLREKTQIFCYGGQSPRRVTGACQAATGGKGWELAQTADGFQLPRIDSD
jgi:hypothetical protein